MKRIFVAVLVCFACATTAYSQVKTQFVEAQVGQSVMLQGAGYSLFDKSVGDNNSFGESIHVGWGKTPLRSTGVYVAANTIAMPGHDEQAAVFSLGVETRRYIEINPLLHFYSGLAIGGTYAANSYDLGGGNKRETRLGLSMEFETGVQRSFGKHLYAGASLHLTACQMLSSTYKPTAAMPSKGGNFLAGNKIMLTAGYRL